MGNGRNSSAASGDVQYNTGGDGGGDSIFCCRAIVSVELGEILSFISSSLTFNPCISTILVRLFYYL